MINNSLADLYWKTNANEFLGYPPRTLIIIGYIPGGGFAGEPQKFRLGLVSGIASNQPQPESAEFPTPNGEIEYTVGGHLFSGYHYKE